MSDPTIPGSCLCGAVRFSVTVPVRFAVHCHCSRCRKAHGAAFVTWVGVPDPGFRFDTGESEVGWYASSPEARRGFCRACGSPLFFRSTRWPGEVHVVRASLEGDPGMEPKAHVFADARVPWVTLGDDLPVLGGATGTEPIGSG